MKKLTLTVLLLALLLASCSSDSSVSGSNSDTNAVNENITTETEETETGYLDALPVMDMGGVAINTLIRENQAEEFHVEDTGDIIDEAVFNRNLRIEEKYNCKLNWTIEPGNWTYVAQYQDLIRSTVMAGDSTFDLVTGQSNIVQPLNKEGVFVNLLEEKNLDLSKPYWLASYTEGINLKGEVCTVCGDFALTSFSNANVIFFNKSIMDEHAIDYPYEMVLEGKWTIDTMLSMCETVTTDLNGDGEINLSDRVGMGGWNNTFQPFFSAFGLQYTETNPDGKRVLPAPSERMIEAAERMNEFRQSDLFIDGDYTEDFKGNLAVNGARHFMENRYLFFGQTLDQIENLREMEVDFGILPYPKYDEQQERYYTTILRTYSVAAVPGTAVNSGNSAMILEALSADGYETIVPKYYEVALKNKYVRDDSSCMVIDLIKNSLYLEFLDMYYSEMDGFSDFFSGYTWSKAGTFVSEYNKKAPSVNKKLEQLYAE